VDFRVDEVKVTGMYNLSMAFHSLLPLKREDYPWTA